MTSKNAHDLVANQGQDDFVSVPKHRTEQNSTRDRPKLEPKESLFDGRSIDKSLYMSTYSSESVSPVRGRSEDGPGLIDEKHISIMDSDMQKS